jgi:predicted nucleic acid-binding protein
MIVILDTSAAIEIVLKREKAEAFKRILRLSERIITSELFKIEAANVLRKYYKGKYLQENECFQLLELSNKLVNDFVPISIDHIEALQEAIKLDCSAYDMLYLILARRYNAILLTCDSQLNRIAKNENILTIENYSN